ncbi:hypothetical protein DEIPH_ctg008orf0066 [Deinococcus phoenicis]|uniref:Uncharacterized protein n=1 Tax=Deinococcus phoenicis TaxID=1476583 RepID=A0A016QTL7_9DEIO|nr:hypothetical protein DEIPH_ctg008orf0066 [Deinococcus phoenicis]
MTFGDFQGLLRDAYTQSSTVERVSRWLGWMLQQPEGEAFFTDLLGRRHSLEAAHLLIQTTPEWQLNLYRMAMSFWR